MRGLDKLLSPALAALRKVHQHLRQPLFSERTWRGAGSGLLAATTLVVLLYLALTVLTDFSWQKLAAFTVWLLVSAGGGLLALLAVLGIMELPSRYRLIAAACTPLLLIVVVRLPSAASYLGLALLVLVASIMGGSLASWRTHRAWALSGLAASALAIVGVTVLVFFNKPDANPQLADYRLANTTLDLPNPGLPGSFQVSQFSYGSGEDRHRSEYGSEADYIARSVDGSKLIDNWSGWSGSLRSSYWGFDASALPLQARVWMPEGQGPFPLVLVVHGNHGMEDYSDPGYDYLGEHLASRGIILASVDENFINSSYSARVDFFADRPGLREENDARGWLLLEHLRQWRDWNADPQHDLYGLIDMEKLALIGHSRGGEAVGIAAAFNDLEHYPDDASQLFDFGFNLRGVIAIAPVYGQYQPRERPTPIVDVNYFTIHGDMDGDVQSFEGAAQYSRVSFTGDGYRFRSSLYVVGANHGQFNTTWENLDTSPFFAWVLDTPGIMPPKDQRDVARVYFTAFLDAVLYDRNRYLPLFRNASFGADWLPQTFYINQFADSNEQIIVDFENDMDVLTLDRPGGRVEAENLTRWFEAGNELKYDELDTHSLFAAWDSAVHSEGSALRFQLGAPVSATAVVMSLSPTALDTKPAGWEESGSSGQNADTGNAPNQPLDWTLLLTDSGGRQARAQLSTDQPLYPLIKAKPRRADFLDDTEPSERLFRRYELALSAFEDRDAGFSATSIVGIDFVFDRSPAGSFALDYIAIEP